MGLARRGAAVVCCLLAVVSFSAGAARAGVIGSYHDFSADPIATAGPWRGTCAACHTPHAAQDALVLWTRPLTEERAVLLQVANPDYLPGRTLVCYDCHDDNATTISPALDNSPVKTSWANNQWPQNIAFTDDVWSQGGTLVGYYEKYDAHLSPQDGIGPTDGSATGGHYWKRPNAQLSGTPAVRQGDKIDCALCHDPHNELTGTNEVFFRTSTTDGGGGTVTLGDGLKASDKNDLTNPNRSRNGTGTGREMCAACHAYSDFDTPKTLWGSPVPAPPPTLSQHRRIDDTPCVKCHLHNRINASCRECHGYPPLLTEAQAGGLFDKTLRPDAENYANGAGAHQRHKDALGDAIFACEICHGPDGGAAPWHNEGIGVVTQGNVNVMGQTTYWGSALGVGYAGIPGGALQAGYSFTAKGGNDGASGGRCYNLACHGNPPDVAGGLNWTDTMVNGDSLTVAGVAVNEGGTGAFDGADGENVCLWCHDGTPARIGTGPWAPNVVGTGGAPATATNWGAKVNGHGLAATSQYDKMVVGDAASGRNGAGKDCAVCHDARYKVNAAPPPSNVPYKTHFDGLNDSAQKRLKGTDGTTINGQTPATAALVCIACHQTAGPDSGTQVSHHGNDGTGGYQRLEPLFTRDCRQCHDVHGANWNGAGRNLNMIGTWLDADNDGVVDAGELARVDSEAVDATKNITVDSNAVVFTSRTGVDSFDEVDTVVTQDADDLCATCHAPATGGGGGTGGGLHDGTIGPFDMRGQDCTQCHDHDFDDVPTPPDGFMPSGCEGCHGKEGIVHRGLDGTGCTPDDAPNVMTVNVGGTWTSVWDGTWWDSQQGGSNTSQQGGHGDPDGKEGGNAALTPTCLACHNTSDPPGTHLNGVYNSAGSELPRGSANWACASAQRPKANANANTSHLLPAYFTEFPANGPGTWGVQVAMDNYCFSKCHAGNSVQDMRHERDTQPGDAAHGSLQMGTHLTRTAPLTYVMDADLNSTVSGLPNYAPCVACHNPHGSVNIDSKGSGPAAKNHMLIDDWQGDSTLCSNCHQ